MKRIENISRSNVVIGSIYMIEPGNCLDLDTKWMTPQITTSIKAHLDMHLIKVFEVEECNTKIETSISSSSEVIETKPSESSVKRVSRKRTKSKEVE